MFLLVLPILIGFASEMVFRDARRASFAAAVGSALVVFLGVFVFDPAGTWNWIAALLVSPLPMALGVVTVLYCYGRLQMRKPGRHHGDVDGVAAIVLETARLILRRLTVDDARSSSNC